MNDEARESYDRLIEILSNDPNTINLRNEIEELENKLADDSNYMTTNANGEPIQAGGNLIRINNFEKVINRIDNRINEINARIETLNNYLNSPDEEIDENTVREYELGAQQAQLVGDDEFLDEYRNLAESKRNSFEVTGNREKITEELAVIQAELRNLENERANVSRDIESLKARMEKVTAKDEQGNVLLDRKGNPIVPVDFNRKLADERRLSELKEKFEKTGLGSLNNLMSELKNRTTDFSGIISPKVDANTDEVKPQDEQPTNNKDVNSKYDKSKSITNQVDENGNLIPAELVYNDEQLAGKYFMHPEYGKVEGMSNAVYSDGTVSVKVADGSIVYVNVSDLSLTDEFTKETLEKMAQAEIDAAMKESEKEEKERASRLAERRKNNWMARYVKEDENHNELPLMDGSALDRLESEGIYMPQVKGENEMEEEKIVSMEETKDNEKESEMSAMAANDVDTKETVEEVSESTEEQKKDAKDKLLKLKKALLAVGIGALTFVGMSAILKNHNKSDDATVDQTQETEADTNVDEEINVDDIISDVVETSEKRTELTDEEFEKLVRDTANGKYGNGQDRINNLREELRKMGFDESVIDSLIGKIQAEIDKRYAGTKPVQTQDQTQTDQSNIPYVPLEQLQQYTMVNQWGGDLKEVKTEVKEASEADKQAAMNDLNDGNTHVGDTLAGTGQTVLYQETVINPGGYQGTKEEVTNNIVTPDSSSNNENTESVVVKPGETINTPSGDEFTNTTASNVTYSEEIVEDHEVLPDLSDDELEAIKTR